MRRKYLSLIGLLILSIPSAAITVNVSGSWTEFFSVMDLAGPPGSDLIPSRESASDQVTIDVTDANNNWEVSVRKVDIHWHPDFLLRVRRTSAGTGRILFGWTYQEVTDINTFFFRSFFFWFESKNALDIHIQYDISGLSVNIPPDTYTTTIENTIVEI